MSPWRATLPSHSPFFFNISDLGQDIVSLTNGFIEEGWRQSFKIAQSIRARGWNKTVTSTGFFLFSGSSKITWGLWSCSKIQDVGHGMKLSIFFMSVWNVSNDLTPPLISILRPSFLPCWIACLLKYNINITYNISKTHSKYKDTVHIGWGMK